MASQGIAKPECTILPEGGAEVAPNTHPYLAGFLFFYFLFIFIAGGDAKTRARPGNREYLSLTTRTFVYDYHTKKLRVCQAYEVNALIIYTLGYLTARKALLKNEKGIEATPSGRKEEKKIDYANQPGSGKRLVIRMGSYWSREEKKKVGKPSFEMCVLTSAKNGRP